jgi:CRP-like cAMP-binding protein
MEELILMLKRIHPLSPELEAYLRTIIKPRIYRAGEHLLQVGEISKDILFLKKGLVMSYYPRRKKEVANWFMKEGDICISILSFFRQQPSVDSIVAYEYCECWGITHPELQATYQFYPEFNRHAQQITSEYYCRSEERHQAILRQTAEEKYARLVQNDPDLIRRVKNKHLASFLNVADRTYYASQKKYANRKRKKKR